MPPSRIAHPAARDRLLVHHERDEPLGRALVAPARRSTSTPGELLLERAGPGEARPRSACGRGVDVAAVQRVAGLEAQRVAGAEAARDDRRARGSRSHSARASSGRAQELAAALARVAGPADEAVDAEHRARRAT